MFGNTPFGFSVGSGGGGTIGGGGTLNYLCKFTPDGTTIGNSLLFDNGVSVGLGTITPSASAILDLTSTSQGFLSPRMTTTERDAISAPVNGLFIYNTTTSFFNYWNGSAWIQIDTSTGGDVSGSGTTNYAVKWTDGTNSVIGDSSWYYSANDYLPVTSGSNIGDSTHRIGTIFMASVFDYSNDLSWVTSSSTKMTLTTSGNLGIGTASPIGSIEVSGNLSTQQIYITRYSADALAGGIIGRKARGTSGSPSAVLLGDTLSLLGGRGYGTTGFSSTNKANVSIMAAENWTDVAQGTYISFNTTTAGGTTRAEVAKLDNSALTLSAIAINEVQATNIASASTTDIGAAKGNYVVVTGTTTITSLGTVQAGTRRIVTFSGALTLTYNAVSLILPTSSNITTIAGDSAVFISLGSGNWKCTQYQRNDGSSLGYIFSTGLKNTSGTITNNLSTGITGGQSVIGGTAASEILTLSSTSNVTKGTIQIGSTDLVNVGNAVTTNQRLFRIGQDTATIDIGSLVGTTAQGVIYLSKTTPSATNYSLSADSSGNTYVNAENGFTVQLRTNNVTRANIGGTFMSFTVGAASTSSLVPYIFTTPASTNQTASTETIGFRVNMTASIQHATGAITTQRDFVIDARTHTAVAASTITTAGTLVITAAPIAGTNVTITNPYAFWIQSGNALIQSGNLVMQSGIINITAPTAAATGGFITTSNTTITGANSQNPTGFVTLHSGSGYGSSIYYGLGVQNRSTSALSAGMGVGILMGLGYGGGSFINTKITSYAIGAVSSSLDSAFGIQTSIGGTVAERFTFYKESFGINTTTPNSYFNINGSFSTAYITKTAKYILTASDYTVDCTANTFDITLPTAVSITGRIYVINNSGSGVITLNTTSAQTIDGNASGVLTLAQNKSYTVQSNGTNWIIIALK